MKTFPIKMIAHSIWMAYGQNDVDAWIMRTFHARLDYEERLRIQASLRHPGRK